LSTFNCQHLNDIKNHEFERSKNFQIASFTSEVALKQDNSLKSPQELMDSFTSSTLKLENSIPIINGIVHTSSSKNSEIKYYKLKAKLQDGQDWKYIYSKIRELKETKIYLDREHTPEVGNILKDFRDRKALEKEQGKEAYIKNLTLHVENNTFEVYSILKNKFLKDL
jgi:hypothetical protein